MALVLGLNAVTVRDTSGTIATPAWLVVTNIRDETLSMDTSLADVTTRAARGWRLQVGTLSEGSIDAQVLYDTSDADFKAFQKAFMDKTMILMGFFDEDPTVAANVYSGLQGGFSVTNFTINRQLEEAMMVDVTFTVREDDQGNGPTWQDQVTVL